MQRALDLLVTDGKVKEKINGKQKAYVVDQEGLPAATDAQIKEMDVEVSKRQVSVSH